MLLGEATGVSLLCGGLGVVWFPFGKNAKTETNIMAIIAKTINPFAFLLNRQPFSLKKPFLPSDSRDACRETNLN
ncbi:MAG: hypothetical protein M1167_00580 [Chloroflexi bacterium]|nr:hypothetical protein [Chloroflexota bacterium]